MYHAELIADLSGRMKYAHGRSLIFRRWRSCFVLVLPLAGFVVGALVFWGTCDADNPTQTLPLAPLHVAEADDCYHVYVDLGTNIGVQIHKLYNAEYFPTAPSET